MKKLEVFVPASHEFTGRQIVDIQWPDVHHPSFCPKSDQSLFPEKSILLTGLRGVGKTVLLNEIDRFAAKAGYRTVSVEAHEDKSLAALLVPPMRTLLFELDRIAGAGDKAKRALAVLKGFMNDVKVKMGEIEVGLDIDPEKGAADSGDLESDLPNLFLAVAEAAEERKMPVALLIDELQYFNPKELSALIMARSGRRTRSLNIYLQV